MDKFEDQKLKLKKAFSDTLSSDLKYNKPVESIDYTVLTKAMLADKTLKCLGCTVSMFNYVFQGDNAVLIVFSYYPKEDTGLKRISEKAIEVVGILQEVFVTVDYVDIVTPKSEGYVYIVCIKKV